MSNKAIKDMEEGEVHTNKWKKSIWKGCILYDAYIWHSGKGKAIETVQRHWLPGSGETEEDKQT